MIPNIDNPDFINFPRLDPELREFTIKLPQIPVVHTPSALEIEVKKGVIPNPRFEQKRNEWKQRDLERDSKVKIFHKEVDDDNGLSNDEKQAIKRLISKLNGYYKPGILKEYISRVQSDWEDFLTSSWEHPENISKPWDNDYWIHPDKRSAESKKKQIPSFKWLDSTDGQYDFNSKVIKYPKSKKEIQTRNEAIQNIRENLMKKSTKHSYEHLGDCTYKSREDYERFFKILESNGLLKYKPEYERENFYDAEGYYRSAPMRIGNKIPAEEFLTNRELGKKFSELGGEEVNL